MRKHVLNVLIGATMISMTVGLCGCNEKTLEIIDDNAPGYEEEPVFTTADVVSDDMYIPYVPETGPVGYGKEHVEPDGDLWWEGFEPDLSFDFPADKDFPNRLEEGQVIMSNCAEYDISRLSFTADDISIDEFDSGCYVIIHVLNISDRQIKAEVLDGMVRYQKLKGNESEPFIHKMYQGTDLVDIPADYMLEPDESVDIVAYMPDVKKGYITFQQLDGVVFIRKIGE